ncbi:AT-rich interactive domain-containing protein 6-like isoform X1 [Malania oleifera]|uniref:AT-rich interactive domain-containing protein 6-like isoform X1 n=1 Tax=Malania oleifera TaxID=397392 RepID=UPI0025AEBC26|nr:AT-rich interactive domain-containing protein 6-like isoform X1 [Malania oleifera]XP_057971753.1 AT-rich interactive domain-containing protein 6-like isoform X1 [Malania oleifera]XP_057971754.1 AT-rich interactive domain-containing protein 6-like isoform X1 [Malania oleifera]
MDDIKEVGKDMQDVLDRDPAQAEVEGEKLPSIESEKEPHNLSDNVKLQPKEHDNTCLELPVDEQCSVESVAVEKAPNAETDAHANTDADANTSSHANMDLDTNMNVDANNNGGGNTTSRGHAAVTTMDADANMQADAITHVNANVNTGVNMEADTITGSGATTKADADIDANPDSGGDVKIDSDANPDGEVKIDGDANINVDADANEQCRNSMTEGISRHLSGHLKSEMKSEENEKGEEVKNGVSGMELLPENEIKVEVSKAELGAKRSFLWEPHEDEGSESGTEEEQTAFMQELETFFKERSMEFKPPKFYGEGLNCLKLWRAVTRLGGYDQVTSGKLWRQVGESFKPPKTCTTVSWTFRCFYEKALLEYEKHELHGDELSLPDTSFTEPTSVKNQVVGNTTSGRTRRDAAARAMQGWHSQRLLGNGEVGDPIIKDKNSSSMMKREKQLKSIGLLKRKKPYIVDRVVKAARMKATKPQSDTMVVDIGPSADWVKVNVQRTKDCFEVYALVPGLLREEVRVQSDPAGRLVISGQPEQLDNPWGVTPFKKVVSLPSRIDPHQTSAVVTLHGQLFVRVPFEQSDL